MGLLAEIRTGAVDSSTDLTQVLRNCMILAYRLNHQPFRDWVNQELNGYDSRKSLPDYRIVPAAVRVNAASMAYRITGQVIHPNFFPSELHDDAIHCYLTSGVAELEALASEEQIRLMVSPRLYNHITTHLENDFELTGASRDVSPTAVKGVLSVIRNRVVEFRLSIEAEGLDVDEAHIGSSPTSPKAVDQMFQVIILGEGHAISLGDGSAVAQTAKQDVQKGNLDSLKAFLREQGINPKDLSELDDVIAEAVPEDLDDDQSRLRRWAGQASEKASAGGKELVRMAARELVLLSIRYYFGQATD